MFLSLGARVIAVDPQPQCVARLHERFASADVEVVAKGLADKQGSVTLVLNESNSGLSTMSDRWRRIRFPNADWGDEVTVPVTTLDDLVERYGVPAFCKIDVEGYERQVLAGLSTSLKVLSFEFTGLFLDDVDENLRCLSSLGPIEVNCSLYEQMTLVARAWMTPDALQKSLRKRAERDEVLSGDIYVRWRDD